MANKRALPSVDYLGDVRKAIMKLERKERGQVAEAANISPRTLDLIAGGGTRPLYDNVLNVYRVLRDKGLVAGEVAK